MSIKAILQKHFPFLQKPERFARLKLFPCFEQLNNYELSLLDALFYERKYQTGEIIYEKDFPVELIYFIVIGEVNLQESQKSYGSNQILELEALFASEKRLNTAVATKDTELLAISKNDLDYLINKEKGLGIKILRNFCIQLSQAHQDKPC